MSRIPVLLERRFWIHEGSKACCALSSEQISSLRQAVSFREGFLRAQLANQDSVASMRPLLHSEVKVSKSETKLWLVGFGRSDS